ncbi:MMPL family transporter [Paenibacillus senegalimassiliensis]|uniref:MMPL family transporter n=1 Tax=Paenibacillus senegalimassiliensis TaxID=1737426 RepID=UPI001E2ED586|nr:MMPL family transporter [Paenibacillus senegalimassiliensis]
MFKQIGTWFTGPKARWATLLAWIAIAVLLTIFLPAVGDEERNNAPNLPADSPSLQAAAVIEQYFPGESGFPALVVWQRAEGLNEQDYGLIANISQQLEESPLEGQGALVPLHRLPPPALAQMASEDGSTFVQPIIFEEGIETGVLKESLHELQERVKDTADSDPFSVTPGTSGELSLRISGPAGISVDATDLFLGADFVLLVATVLLVLVLLLLIYRSPILAIIPLVGVGFAYVVTSPILGWLAREGWIVVDSQAIAIMTVLLFGAGTDYCLFFITRFRQELLHDGRRTSALRRSFQGASGAIAMSGFTVVLSLLALLVAKYGAYERFAVPFSLSILVMMIASLTLVPALLSIIGRAAFFPFIPRTPEEEQARAAQKGKTYKPRNPERAWGARIGKLVVTKPWTVVVSCIMVLGILATFATQISFTYDLLSSFPKDMPSRQGFEQIAKAYTPGELAPVTVVAKDGPDLTEALLAHPAVDHVGEAQVSTADPAYSSYSVVLAINPYSLEAMEAIPELREVAAAALEADGVAQAHESVWVSGQTAEQYDTKAVNDRDNRVIIPLVIALITLLLLVYLRSVTATAYLVLTVLLSYAAALGLGWIILHYGFGVEAIQGSIPLYSFVFLIALGEDYNIFMISSIWQKAKRMPLKQAIKEGVAETGGVITSAGLILAATFAVLATMPIQVLVQFGFITAIGVLMDTFIVRPFLVPALTSLLGNAAFWPSRIQQQEALKEASAD